MSMFFLSHIEVLFSRKAMSFLTRIFRFSSSVNDNKDQVNLVESNITDSSSIQFAYKQMLQEFFRVTPLLLSCEQCFCLHLLATLTLCCPFPYLYTLEWLEIWPVIPTWATLEAAGNNRVLFSQVVHEWSLSKVDFRFWNKYRLCMNINIENLYLNGNAIFIKHAISENYPMLVKNELTKKERL